MGLLDLLIKLSENKNNDKNINELVQPPLGTIYEDDLEEDDYHFEDEE